MAMQRMNFKTPPIMFAAWPGMGNVGLMAIDTMRKSLDATLFAELDLGPFYVPEEVVVEKGMARFPEIPHSYFHEQHDPNLVFFESTMETTGKDSMVIAQTVLEVAKKLKAPRIFTAAAFPIPMSYKNPCQIFAASNRNTILTELQSFGIEPMPAGFISGLSGLVLGIAASRNIDAACILAKIPTYAAELSYPKASLAIVRTFARILDIEIDTAELEHQIFKSEQEFEDVEERLRNVFPDILSQEEDIVKEEDNETKEEWPVQPENPKAEQTPAFVMERIEQLFRSISKTKDKSRATELKVELDKWGLYDLYENRFLDLFKDEDRRDNPR